MGETVDLLSLTTAGAVAATAGTARADLDAYQNIVAVLNVTAAATDAGDVLAVWLQGNVEGVWFDIGRFADVLGNGGAVKRVLRIMGNAVTTAEEAVTDGTLAAASVKNGPWGPTLRAKYSVTDANANSAFTFAVTAYCE